MPLNHDHSLFIVAGEESGDALGAALMNSLIHKATAPIHFYGVGGQRMIEKGLRPLFPQSDIAVMGILPVLARLPLLMRRIDQTARAVLENNPTAVILIDSPDFTHRVARKIRRWAPDIPIIIYVSPTVWAWRPKRAQKMTGFTDKLLALLPFEPEAHKLLAGPPTDYVGHPLAAHPHVLQVPFPRALSHPRHLVVLPGSRKGEITKHLNLFANTLALLKQRIGDFNVVVPTASHVREAVTEAVTHWPVKATCVHTDEEKWKAFARADAALAVSGTVTLELALMGVPMVVAYKLDWLAARLRFMINVPEKLRSLIHVRSIVLPNIILNQKVFPEFIHELATPENLALALQPLLDDTSERQLQTAGIQKLRDMMMAEENPADKAAHHVLELLPQLKS